MSTYEKNLSDIYEVKRRLSKEMKPKTEWYNTTWGSANGVWGFGKDVGSIEFGKNLNTGDGIVKGEAISYEEYLKKKYEKIYDETFKELIRDVRTYKLIEVHDHGDDKDDESGKQHVHFECHTHSIPQFKYALLNSVVFVYKVFEL